MKTLTLTIALIFLFPFIVHAQEMSALAPNEAAGEVGFDFERAYQDYVFTTDVYNNQHSAYLLAKAQYKQAGTLVSQTKAQEETVKMLEARDDVVITYLTSLRMKLSEAEGVSNITKNGLFTRLDAEIAWFSDHKSRIRSAGTLDDLAADSDEASNRFSSLSEVVAYETLATYPFGKLSLMREETNSILSAIKDKIFEVRSNGDKDTAIIERWAFEIENKITRSLDKEIEAQSIIPSLTGPGKGSQRVDRRGFYNSIIFKLDESRQFLRDATEFMNEIIREITTL